MEPSRCSQLASASSCSFADMWRGYRINLCVNCVFPRVSHRKLSRDQLKQTISSRELLLPDPRKALRDVRFHSWCGANPRPGFFESLASVGFCDATWTSNLLAREKAVQPSPAAEPMWKFRGCCFCAKHVLEFAVREPPKKKLRCVQARIAARESSSRKQQKSSAKAVPRMRTLHPQ